MEIDGVNYIDGGYYDNIPAAAAFSLGAQRAVIIDLNNENNHEGYIDHPWVTYIRPSRDLGTFLNFDRDVLDSSIKLGYNDTMKVYGKYFGGAYTFIPSRDKEFYDGLGELFIGLLTETEPKFDFSGSVRLQRINKQPGCTSILADRCRPAERNAAGMFFAALEMYMKILGFDENTDYCAEELLYLLKDDIDPLYPMLDLGTAEAFEKMEEFIEKKTSHKNSEYKKIDDDDRMKIILMSAARTLQQMRL